MKKILIIASEFPPRNIGNMLRTVKLVKHLPSLGWKPYILTISKKWIEKYDNSWEYEVSREACIIRTFYPNPFVFMDRKWHRKEGARSEKTDIDAKNMDSKIKKDQEFILKNITLKIIRFLRINLFIPEELILWLPFAVIKGILVCRKEKIDLIYSTSPAYTNHLVGLVLKFLTRKKWFVDYRDLWTGYVTRKLRFKFRKKIERFLEIIVLRNADRVNIVSPQWREFLLEKFRFLSSEKVTSYTNGYDLEDYSNVPTYKNSDKWKITYAGSILYDYPTPLFLRAIGELCEEIPEVRKNVRVNFYGRINQDQMIKIMEEIKKFSLNSNVSIKGEVAREEVISEMKNSQFLLLMYLNGRKLSNNGCIPAKLFEYIGARKPIIALLPRGGYAAEIIQKGRIGEVVLPNSYEEIKDMLNQLYFKYKNGNNFNPDWGYLEQFERRYIVNKLVAVFNELLEINFKS